MKVIGLFGYIEKVDLIVSLAKTVQLMGKTVLVIDATAEKKYKCVIPTLETADFAYITQFDNVDYAVGFESLNDVENYLTTQRINIGLYDFIFIDIDNHETYEFFRNRPFNNIFFVLDTSMLGHKKNLDIINSIKIYSMDNNSTEIVKIIYRAYLTRTAERYFQNELNKIECNWNEKEYEIYETERDRMLYLDFQISGIVQMRKHSKLFQNSIINMVMLIVENVKTADIKRAIKKGGI